MRLGKKLISLSKSSIGDEEKKAVIEVLQDEYLGMGSRVGKFEKLLTNYLESNISCVASGTAALHLALQAIGVTKGDEVLAPSYTYVATFQAIAATGAKPIPTDIEKDTLNMSLADADKRITDATKALVYVPIGGNCEDLDEVFMFCKHRNLRCVIDAAHAFGSTVKGRLVGSFGDIITFSFDGIKNITCGEGGCVATQDASVVKYINDARLLGVENDTSQRLCGVRSWDFDVKIQGWRYHMNEIAASIGIEQFYKLGKFREARQKLAKCYDKQLQTIPNLTLYKRNYEDTNPHIYQIQLPKKVNRVHLRDYLKTHKIEIGFHYKPNHTLTHFKNGNHFPNIDSIWKHLVSLPLHPDLTLHDVEYICDTLKNYLE